MTAIATGVELRCPVCGRFLADVDGFIRVVCGNCGWEIQVASPEARQRRRVAKYPLGG